MDAPHRLLQTHPQGGGGPFYVRTHDIGKSVERDGQWVVVMECLEADAEAIDLDEPANLYSLLYQARACMYMLCNRERYGRAISLVCTHARAS